MTCDDWKSFGGMVRPGSGLRGEIGTTWLVPEQHSSKQFGKQAYNKMEKFTIIKRSNNEHYRKIHIYDSLVRVPNNIFNSLLGLFAVNVHNFLELYNLR